MNFRQPLEVINEAGSEVSQDEKVCLTEVKKIKRKQKVSTIRKTEPKTFEQKSIRLTRRAS